MSTLATQLLSYRAKVYVASGILVDDQNEVDRIADAVSNGVDHVAEGGMTHTLYDYTAVYATRLYLYEHQ